MWSHWKEETKPEAEEEAKWKTKKEMDNQQNEMTG